MAKQSKGWKYSPDLTPEDAPESGDNSAKNSEEFSWSSTNGPENTKRLRWYMYLLLVTVGLSALVLLLTKDKTSTVVVLVCGLIFGVYGARKPNKIDYKINDVGFTIGKKDYIFTNFKSFYVLGSNNHYTLALTPLKRFMPYTYLNFSDVEAAKVQNIVGSILPLQKNTGDIIERFTRYIGF